MRERRRSRLLAWRRRRPDASRSVASSRFAPGLLTCGLPASLLLAIGTGIPSHAADLGLPRGMQERVDKAMEALKGDFTLTLGARGYYEPRYEGGKPGQFSGLPLLSIKPKGSFEKFTSPRESSGVTIWETEQVYFGPVVGFNNERYPSDDRSLRGSRTVDFAVEPGLFIEYFPTPAFRMRAEFRQGIGGHHGEIFDFSADFIRRFDRDKWLIAAGPRVTLATAAALRPYFDVTPAQAAATGLPAYVAKGGLRSAGFGVDLRYNWTPRFQTEIFGEYERLLDSVAGSPLVRVRGDANQYKIGIGFSYKFDFHSPM